jgi:excisionase family DNA binding protein
MTPHYCQPDDTLPLAEAAKRLRQPAGRPRRRLAAGSAVQGAPANPVSRVTESPDFAATLPPRGLSLEAGASYLGISRRAVYRLVEQGHLRLLKLPGCRRALLDRRQLDRLLDAGLEGSP